MLNLGDLRKYGKPPFSVVVVHGGPGAGGEMAPVARELASEYGVLEPIQTATSLEDQVQELKNVLKNHGDLPIILIGFSWGAWLSFIFTANHPSFVKKLMLIGSGPFEEKYATKIQDTRFSRLNNKERTELKCIMEALSDPGGEDRNLKFARLGAIITKADTYTPSADKSEPIDYRLDIFQSVWIEAAGLRRNGMLLKLGKHVKCPVVAIHGDYDPHPALGVKEPLSAALADFRFILLKSCGHRPWIEQEVREDFFKILKEELNR